MIPALSVQQLAKGTSRARTLLLGVTFLVTTVVALAYHLLAWATKSPSSTLLSLLYQAVVVIGFASLWALLSQVLSKRRPSPARVFWSLTLVGIAITAVSMGIALIARPTQIVEIDDPTLLLGFDLQTGVPLVLATVFKMNLLSLLQGGFAVFLMLRLRDLVLVKRTRSSQRNWNVMIVMMVLTALTVVMHPPGAELGELQVIALIVTVVFMLVNSFRLSWIVFLSFREKVSSIGLSVLLLVVLGLGIGVSGESIALEQIVPGASAYSSYYSTTLALFVGQAALFGLLYCITALLSLVFHLPTSGEFQQRSEERAAMSSLSHVAGNVFDPDHLHNAITTSPVEAGVAHSAWLALADPDSGSLRPTVVATHGVDIDRLATLLDVAAIYEDVAIQRAPVVLQQAPADHRVKAKPGDGVGSLVAAPLIARDSLLGALFVAKNVVHGFERDEIETVGLLASQAALTIENARLFEQQVEKERLARELAIAREVQQRLLPQDVPRMSGLSMAASSVSAQEVGGDYYDFAQLSSHKLAIIIADVSGKGTSAAFYMAEMQGIFHALSRLAPSPCDFLGHANAALNQSLERNVFVSVVYGTVDVEREELIIARAGHCPVASVGIDGTPTYLRTRGIGLGLDRSGLFKASLEESRIPLKPGDVFALYTDGVVESRDHSGEEYGYDRLLAVLEENRHEDAADIHAAIIDDLQAFQRGREYDDDMTLVVLKWHGLPIGAVPKTTLAGKA